MQFKYATDKSSLCDDVDFLCKSTSASYPILDKLRNVNQAYHDTARLIWQSSDDWNWDDTNQAGLPVAYRTLANASATYLLPTTAFSIEGVEVKDGNSNWLKLAFKDFHDIGISPEEYLSGEGVPEYYDLDGSYVRLFPPPASGSVTVASGLCLRLSRDVTEFTSASTASPGFPAPFHRILSVATALDFEQDPKQRELLIFMKNRLEKGLSKFFAHRATESPNKIYPQGKRQWRQYV